MRAGIQPPPRVRGSVCAKRCPECGEPCLNKQGHGPTQEHFCQRNHRWSRAGEAEVHFERKS